MQCCVFDTPPSDPGPGSQIDIVFWINPFIPLNFEDVTHPWPKHPGKTVIKAFDGVPLIGGCFVTDQRGFSDALDASARMHSQAGVQIDAIAYHWSQMNHCGQTIKVDCGDGSEKKHGTADTDDMKFTLKEGSSNRVVLAYKGSAGNPLVPSAPTIDIVGTLTVDRVNKFIEFSGKVDDFPAFEAYFEIDGRGPYKLIGIGPKPGPDASSLFGAANRAVSARLYF